MGVGVGVAVGRQKMLPEVSFACLRFRTLSLSTVRVLVVGLARHTGGTCSIFSTAEHAVLSVKEKAINASSFKFNLFLSLLHCHACV